MYIQSAYDSRSFSAEICDDVMIRSDVDIRVV